MIIKGYEQYAQDVENGIILTNKHIKLAVKRYREFKARKDMYFDESAVDSVINFIQMIRLFEGFSAGAKFKLENWQQFILANIYAFKWIDENGNKTDERVTRDCFFFLARKQGKSSFAAGIALNQLFNDNIAAPSIIMAANSTIQAHQLFEKAQIFSHSIDPKEKYLKVYRNEIKSRINNGKLKVVSSEVKSIEGAGASTYILDEYHQAADNTVLNSLKLSQGSVKNPLGIIITTAGDNQFSPCKKLYDTAVEILNGAKEDDSMFSMLYQLDDDDDWDDLTKLIKANPNLGISKKKEKIEQEILKAKNNTTDEADVKKRVLNLWVSTSDIWLNQQLLLNNTETINIEDFKGEKCWVGVDLAATSDLTAVSVMWVRNDKFYFKTEYFLPETALTEHEQHRMYFDWHYRKQLNITNGNVTDYDVITNYLMKLNQICPVISVAYDSWNSISWASDATAKGLNLQIYSQTLSNYNKPTKEAERLIKSGKIILDNNEITRFCFNNVKMKYDWNGNCKPDKSNNKSKIDGVIAILTCLGSYLQTPQVNTKVYSF